MTPVAKRSVTPADSVAAAEQELATKRLELERAVAAGDVEAVMRLRTFTEVEGPRAVTAAKAAKLDAEIEELEAAIETGELQRREDEAEAALEVARAGIAQAQAVVNEAVEAAEPLHKAYNAAYELRRRGARNLIELRGQRKQLVETSEAEIAARIRAIAGLEPEFVEPTREPRDGAHFEPRIVVEA